MKRILLLLLSSCRSSRESQQSTTQTSTIVEAQHTSRLSLLMLMDSLTCLMQYQSDTQTNHARDSTAHQQAEKQTHPSEPHRPLLRSLHLLPLILVLLLLFVHYPSNPIFPSNCLAISEKSSTVSLYMEYTKQPITLAEQNM